MSLDLKAAYEAFQVKEPIYSLRWAYYEGRHPLRWSTERLEKVFKELHHFVQNWCAVVVDSAIDRIQFERLLVDQNDAETERLDQLLADTGLDLEAVDVHREADVVGESFVIAWKDETSGEIEAYRNDARTCHLFYDPMHPRRPLYGAKKWDGADGKARIVLYYEDRLEYWKASKPFENLSEYKEADWSPDEDSAPGGATQNPYGIVPVFRFTIDSRGVGDLENAIPLQDIVNKTISDMVVVAEYAAYHQRWAITNAEPEGGQFPVEPQSVFTVPPAAEGDQPVAVGTFPASDMSNFTKILDSIAHSIAIITRTPKHYFFSQGSNISGEALVAMEAPLNKKVEKFEKRFAYSWSLLGQFLLVLDGKGEVELSTISPVWIEPATVQPFTQAQVRKTNVDAGIPIITILRDEGWSEDQIEQMLLDKSQTEVTQTPGTEPNASPDQVVASTEEAGANMETFAQAAMQAVADGALDALSRSGALGRLTGAQ